MAVAGELGIVTNRRGAVCIIRSLRVCQQGRTQINVHLSMQGPQPFPRCRIVSAPAIASDFPILVPSASSDLVGCFAKPCSIAIDIMPKFQPRHLYAFHKRSHLSFVESSGQPHASGSPKALRLGPTSRPRKIRRRGREHLDHTRTTLASLPWIDTAICEYCCLAAIAQT